MDNGVLIIAHGSSSLAWVKLVDKMTRHVNLPVPIVTCFLELVENRSIVDGIEQLVQQGVKRIWVVPLFVSSGSLHIDEIACLLGLKQAEHIQPLAIAKRVQIHLCSAMDAHPLIAQIVLDRARELSQSAKNEILFLVGHGSTELVANQMWEFGVAQLKRQLREKSNFFAIQHAYLNGDPLRKRLMTCTAEKQVIVIPLFVSEGYFTNKVIPQKMAKIPVKYSGKTYLPHPLITQWIEMIVKREWIWMQSQLKG